MKTALVYDRVNKWGGAERVLLTLHKIFPDAPLYTSVYNPEKARWARDFKIRTSFLQSIPFVRDNHEVVPFAMPLAFEQFDFDDFDLVISVTSEAAKGIITKPKTKHICYCLTPTRYLWSGYDEYFKNQLLKTFSYPAVNYLRKWDVSASARVDVFASLSKEVQGRIKEYYGRDSELIYPPAGLEIKNKDAMKNKDFFLVVSRLSRFTKYKRIDLVIEACNKMKLPLKIAGYGNWEEDLKKIAGPTVEFLGKVSDEKLVQLYSSCKALIFPAYEDFGLTIVEAQQFGKPVIAYRGGGALETVTENKTGVFFDTQNIDDLTSAIEKFEKSKFSAKDCIEQAEKFNFEIFREKILSLVGKVI